LKYFGYVLEKVVLFEKSAEVIQYPLVTASVGVLYPQIHDHMVYWQLLLSQVANTLWGFFRSCQYPLGNFSGVAKTLWGIFQELPKPIADKLPQPVNNFKKVANIL
jgi:hypothetical protein